MAQRTVWDKIANAFGYVKSVTLDTLGAMGLPSHSFYKTQNFLEAYKSWVYACTKARATDVSRIKLHLFRVVDRKTGEVEEVLEHDALSLLRSVNPFQTRRQLIEFTQAYMDLAGEAFWYLVRGGSGKNAKIVQIWMLRPDWITIKTSPDEFIKGYTYRVPGQGELDIAREDIVHFKEFNPTDPYRGLSIIRAAAATIDVDTHSEEYNRKFYINSARPDVVLRTEQKLDTDLIKRMKAQWQAEYGGADKAHKLAILEGGLDIKPFAVSQKDMEFLEGQRFTRDKIMALFQTPKTVLGMTEDVTVSNAEATDLVFAKRVVDPAMDKIVDVLNEFLLPQYADWNGGELFFEKESPVPENVTAKLDKQKALFALGAMTPNEIRKQNGLDEVPGLDNFYLPINMVPVTGDDQSTGEEAPVKAPAVRRIIKSIDPLTLKERTVREVAGKVNKQVKDAVVQVIRKDLQIREDETIIPEASSIPKEAQEAHWKLFVAKSEQSEKQYISELRKYFARQEKESIDRLNGQKAISRERANKVLFDLAAENKVGAEIFIPILMNFLEEAGNDALDLLGLDDTVFDTSVAAVQSLYRKVALKGIASMNKTTKSKVRKVLSQAIIDGLSIDETARGIKEVFKEADTVRAQRIARTETLRAGNAGALEAYKQSGVVIGKQWFTAMDEMVCEWCAPMNGRVKALNNNFFHQGESFTGKDGGIIRLDYSNIEEPPLHVNCRCTLIPITGTVTRR